MQKKERVSFFFLQAEDGIRDWSVTGVQTCALPISTSARPAVTTMPKPQPLAALDRSDPTVLDHLAKTQRVCLIIVVLIAIVTLCAWVSTGIGIVVPAWSTLMKVNTALIALASAISLMLSESHRSRRFALFSRILAVFVLVVALSSLLEHTFGISLGLDTLIAADPASPSSHPGLMSPQSASSFS